MRSPAPPSPSCMSTRAHPSGSFTSTSIAWRRRSRSPSSASTRWRAIPDSLLLVEWGERFESIVKRAAGEIYMEHGEGDERGLIVRLKE